MFNYLNSIKVSDKNNLFLADWTDNNINSIKNLVNNSSISEEKLLIMLENISLNWTKSPINYPLNVSILEWGEKIIEDIKVSKDELKSFKPLLWLKKSWSYSLEITDSNWFKTTKNFELLADLPNSVDINLSTSVLQTGWNISTNFVTIFDKFLNPVIWNFYDLEFTINWDSVSFLDNWTNKLSTTTYEWYKIFRLKSNNKNWFPILFGVFWIGRYLSRNRTANSGERFPDQGIGNCRRQISKGLQIHSRDPFYGCWIWWSFEKYRTV